MNAKIVIGIIGVMALLAFFVGCIGQPETVGGVAIPVPIPANYLGTNSVTTAKIAGGAVTNVKIVSGAVNNSQITLGAVNNSQVGTTSINDTQLTANAITTNYTTNTTVSMTGTTFINSTSPSRLVLNRTSAAAITYSTQMASTENASMRLIIDNVEQSPGIIFMGNGSGNLASNRALVSYSWFNVSLASGTHDYNVQANVTGGTLTLTNATLFAVAYPK